MRIARKWFGRANQTANTNSTFKFGALVLHLALLVISAGCATKMGVRSLTPSPLVLPTRPASTASPTPRALATATVEQTLAPLPTPQDIESANKSVAQALASPSANAFAPLLLDEIYLAQGPMGDTGQSISREDALQWLNARWGNRRSVVSQEYVEHFVLLEITTSGWARIPPVQSGVVAFHLHRYNAQGGQDPLRGNWRIDSLVYE